ncbi:MAG TPA: hypothetical protein VGP27_14575 [Mycobacterium sp.]|nr:hypothetical protein [Mycobacterium sp.]
MGLTIAPTVPIPQWRDGYRDGRDGHPQVRQYGSAKYVYPRETMTELRLWFESELATTLPEARTLYRT